MGMMRQGMMSGMQDDDGGQGGMGMGRGGMMDMMHGGKGGGMGMMRQGMMGGMQDDDGGQGGMGMGRGGMMGMMHGGGEMHAKHRNLLARLDLLEARMAKIETLLERLLMR